MSLRSIYFSSVESERRWVLEMANTINDKFDISISVIRVHPKTETKPDDAAYYTPQHIGLGPYHHLRPELYALTQKHKLDAVRKFLNPDIDPEILRKVVEAIMQWDPFVRAVYDQYLDFDIPTFAMIMTIDGLYFLHFLTHWFEDPEMKVLTRDIFVLENQIPNIFLFNLRRFLHVADRDEHLIDEFCRAQSPLKLNQERAVLENKHQVHMVHRMYYLIVNNRGKTDDEVQQSYTRWNVDDLDGYIQTSVGFLAEQGVPGAEPVGQILSIMIKVPWDNIFKIGGRTSATTDDDREQNPSRVVEIDIPSVSQMTEFAGVKFTLTSGGIRDVQFVEEGEEKKFYLPVITLSATSEIILRNLLEFESASAKPGSTLELAEYVDLMCGIIDTPKDVSILKNEKIIESTELSDEEIARIFNGISKSTKKTDKKSKLEEAIESVNKKYENLLRVKVERFLKKYVPISCKFLSVLITIAVLVLLILNASCSIFGCGRWFGKNTEK